MHSVIHCQPAGVGNPHSNSPSQVIMTVQLSPSIEKKPNLRYKLSVSGSTAFGHWVDRISSTLSTGLLPRRVSSASSRSVADMSLALPTLLGGITLERALSSEGSSLSGVVDAVHSKLVGKGRE